MTALGGVGHTLPFLIANFYIAMTVAMVIVAIELGVIAWIRHRYMDTPLLSAASKSLSAACSSLSWGF